MESRDEIRRRLGRTDAVIDGVIALAPIGALDEVGGRS